VNKCAILLALCCILAPVSAHAGLILNLGGNAASLVSFNGADDTFEWYNYYAQQDFIVVSVVDLNDPSYTSGSAVGLQGDLDGTFTIGTISTDGTTESAPVSGLGTFSIVDSLGFVLTADLSWVSISSNGSTAGTNLSGDVNLANFQYAGSNPDLVTVAGHKGGVISSSFQFWSPTSLTDLTADNYQANISQWSASVATAPEPGTLFLAGLGLAGLGSMAARRRSKKSSAA